MAKRRSARLQKAAEAPSPSPSQQQTPASHLPAVSEQNESSAATSTPEKPSIASFSSITTRTPRNRTPIKPSGADMHPHHHQASTAKPLEEARWLGFLAKGAHTAPAKGPNPLAITQLTPTKGCQLATNPFSTPNFHFRHKRPSTDLSPEAQRMMEESRAEAQGIRSQLFSRREAPSSAAPLARKMATPKGKASRFSDIHMAQFKKMDSIMSHPSLARTNPSQFSPAKTSLKRSPSKAELDVHNDPPQPAASPRKYLLPSDRHTQFAPGPVPTKPAVNLSEPRDQGKSGSTKRVKRHVHDDTSTIRTITEHKTPEKSVPTTPRRPTHRAPVSTLPRFTSRLLTPTKASLARTQSAKPIRIAKVPSMLCSQPMKAPNGGKSFEDSLKEGIRKTSHSLLSMPGVRSILRSPSRKFSTDPTKIAAGTHMSPPPELNFEAELPRVPATAPTRKHVNFTASAVAKDEQLATPSRKAPERAASEVPLPSTVTYPALPSGDDSNLASVPWTRRMTMGDQPGSGPGSFTFRSEQAVNFGPATSGLQRSKHGPKTGTIRHVRSSDVHDVDAETEGGSKKRKLDVVDEGFDKENEHQEGSRATKKSKSNSQAGPRTPASKLPRRLDKRAGSLTPARLNLLATPKRRCG
ncbi:hypothetical protein BU16DRAFT_521989 [Lophium mytilinum]|uniref:Uncharacterized protein n=1 Tax=Lophium mytilinum TaxID=390894 RepID=A0A6A6REY6_9PEZI|nr:hypothetical protein BU16DRAFT_521989 [Lophium mytilinum]